jgi:DHA1 family multidrug resistance protein-like MFS transporter
LATPRKPPSWVFVSVNSATAASPASGRNDDSGVGTGEKVLVSCIIIATTSLRRAMGAPPAGSVDELAVSEYGEWGYRRRVRGPSGWQRNVWALSLSVFIAFVGFQFFSPFLPLYVRELGVTDPAAIALWSGVLAAVTPTVSGLLAPLFGRLADRFGRKMMLIRSLAGFTVIIAAMGLVTSVQQLFAARFLQGLFAGFTPMAMAVASVSAPREKVATAIARVQGAQLLSVAVGPAIGGLAATHLGIRPAFYVTAALCAVSLIALVFLFEEQRAAPAGAASARPRSAPFREFLGQPHFVPVMALLVIAQFIDRGLALVIPLQVAHMAEVAAPASTSGLIISAAAVGATLSASLAARLSAVVPTGQLLFGQLVAGGAFCAAMALAQGWVSLLVLRVLVALCLGGALTLAYALGGMIVAAEARGRAFGWLAMGVQLGTAASPLLTGALAAASLRAAYFLDGALAWVGALVLVFFARDLLRRRERAEG